MAVVTVPGRHRDEAVDLQDRKEGLVKRLRCHWCSGNHRNLGFNARIDDEVASGDRADGLDDGADLDADVVRRDLLLLCLETWREGEHQ